MLWGAAAGGFTGAPRDQELKTWEKLSGRTATIFHTYHKGDELFPTAAEIAMTQDPAHPRVLLLNWRVEYGSTWANVAAGQAGQADRRVRGAGQGVRGRSSSWSSTTSRRTTSGRPPARA